MKKILAVIVLTLIVGFAIFMYDRPDRNTDRIAIGVSFHPLAEFAGMVGGDRVEIFNLTPPGADPHEFEPSARDMAWLHSADLFLFMGAGIDPWAERADLPGVMTLKMTDRFELDEFEEEDDHDDEEDAHDEDPHIWLDPVLAKGMVEAIRDALIEIDGDGRDEYEANAASAFARLNELHGKYEIGLSSCELDHLIISHASIGYLARRYGFHMVAVSGLSPEEEPSPRKMAEISDLVRSEGVGHILFETTMNPAIAETIARETGAETIVFNNLESPSESEGDYFTAMEGNLEILRTALQCR